MFTTRAPFDSAFTRAANASAMPVDGRPRPSVAASVSFTVEPVFAGGPARELPAPASNARAGTRTTRMNGDIADLLYLAWPFSRQGRRRGRRPSRGTAHP